MFQKNYVVWKAIVSFVLDVTPEFQKNYVVWKGTLQTENSQLQTRFRRTM